MNFHWDKENEMFKIMVLWMLMGITVATLRRALLVRRGQAPDVRYRNFVTPGLLAEAVIWPRSAYLVLMSFVAKDEISEKVRQEGP